MGRKLKYISFLVDEETDIILVKQEDKLDSDHFLNIKNRLSNGELFSACDFTDNVICTSHEYIDPNCLSDNQELQEFVNSILNQKESNDE